MNREPSPHSMTVETPDLESVVTISNLAEKVFLLERWKAEAVVTIGKLEGERDTLQHNLDALLVAGFNTPPGECTNCAEMRVNLSVAEGAVSSYRDRMHEHDRARRSAYDEVSDLKSRVEGLRQTNEAHEQRFVFLRAMVRGALDAI